MPVLVNNSSIDPIHHVVLLRSILNFQRPFLSLSAHDMTSRFVKDVKQSASILRLLPSNINPDSSLDHLEQAVAFYEEDLPNTDLVDEEFHL